MDKSKLEAVLESHGKWLAGDGGERADLCGADLCGVDLCGVDLCRADLRDADLHDADLRDADLRDADLCRADLLGADLLEKIVQIGPMGSRKSYTVYNATKDVVQCGCWNDYKGGTLEEFRLRVDDVYKDGPYREEYMAAIEFFQRMRDMEAAK